MVYVIVREEVKVLVVYAPTALAAAWRLGKESTQLSMRMLYRAYCEQLSHANNVIRLLFHRADLERTVHKTVIFMRVDNRKMENIQDDVCRDVFL